MNRAGVPLIAMIAIVAALGISLALVSDSRHAPPVQTTTDAPGIPPERDPVTVRLVNSIYTPATPTVAVGTTVTWVNDDPVRHTVTPTDKNQWATEGSGDDPSAWMGKDATWSHTFTRPGVYQYYCIPHAGQDSSGAWRGMVATVRVEAAVENPPSPRADARSVAPDAKAPPRTTPGADGIVYLELETREVVGEITDGVTYEFWTFNGTVPGPMLRVRVGDTVHLTLRNDVGSKHPHSIDLHAVTGPGGGAVHTQTAPGAATEIRFQATNPGIYVYHCATPHIPTHVANGMYGLILVEPEEGLPPVDREYYVVQGEVYTQGSLGEGGFQPHSLAKMLDERPEYFLLNGRVGALTGDGALRAEVGQTVRIYFGVGGFVPSSFHVIGEIFDKLYPEGGFPPVENVQTTLVPAGGAAIVEFEVQVPGTYVLVDHWLTRAIDRGAAGHLIVTGPPDPSVYAPVAPGPSDASQTHGAE